MPGVRQVPTHLPWFVPHQAWYLNLLSSTKMIIGGILPFGAVFIELTSSCRPCGCSASTGPAQVLRGVWLDSDLNNTPQPNGEVHSVVLRCGTLAEHAALAVPTCRQHWHRS